uniref:Uncharacterized protein n=1 Tax=Solanum lycopersicum TaxID=4081 RepID=A0A3Q7I468_SOLLC
MVGQVNLVFDYSFLICNHSKKGASSFTSTCSRAAGFSFSVVDTCTIENKILPSNSLGNIPIWSVPNGSTFKQDLSVSSVLLG